MDKIAIRDISQIDRMHSFFHYTDKRNLDGIMKKGLEPRIGENALYVEKTPKVFFVEGEKGIVAIMDVWLKWLTGKLSTSKFKYRFGTAVYMRLPFCIKSIPNVLVKRSLASREKRLKACKKMKEILDNSVFLVLDLEEKVDFDYDDIDEVKQAYYESFLKLLYPRDSNLRDSRMEYWNMHTYSNKTVDYQKIALLKDQDNCDANSVLMNIIEKDLDFVEANYEFLYEYYTFVQDLKKYKTLSY